MVYLIMCRSLTYAQRVANALERSGVPARVLRSPGEISPAGCSYSVKIAARNLARALTVLKPGGVLVYSTCSILPAENEDQVRSALKRHRDCEVAPLEPAMFSGALPLVPNGLEGTLTVRPTKEFEGFYLAKIKKASRVRKK